MIQIGGIISIKHRIRHTPNAKNVAGKSHEAKIIQQITARVQVAEYITELRVKMKSDPFHYWKEKISINKWHLLWPLVQKYLSPPCGSVESERLFSHAKLITTDLRKSISEDNLKKLLFVHENLPLINFEY
jgi:hypothetical protein